MGKPVPSLSTNYLPTKTVQHLLNEITKITRFIAVSSEAPCSVVFWHFQSAMGKRDSRLACQWSVPLSVCFPSKKGGTAGEMKPEEEEHDRVPTDPSFKKGR